MWVRASNVAAAAAASLRDLTRGGRGFALGAVALGWFLTLGSRFLVPSLVPQIRAEFAVSNATIGVAITATWLFYGMMQFPSGLLVDRVGERRLLAISLGLIGLSLGLLSVAPIFPVFLLAASVFGFASGLYGPARGTTLSKAFPDRDSAAFGITLAAGSLGSAALPALGSVLVGRFGWRIAIAVTVPLFVLAAAFAWRTVPSFGDGETETPPIAGLRAGLSRAILRRSILFPALGVTFMVFTYQALTAFLPTYLIEVKGLGQSTAATLFALLFVCGAGFQLAIGSAATRVGDRPVLVGLAAVGTVTLIALPLFSGLIALAALIVVLSSRLAVPPVINAYILDGLPNDVQGSAWGLLRTGFFLVGATGSTVVGIFADAGLFDEAFYVLGVLTAVATVIFVGVPTRKRSAAE